MTIERHGNLVYMSHNYVQNDDLMNDPLVVMRLDEDAMKMKIISFENSGTGMYQHFDSHEISEMEQSCADYINETWCSDIENGGWVLTDKPMSELLAPHTYDMNGKADKPLTVEERSKMMGDWAEKVIVKRTDPEINISTSAR